MDLHLALVLMEHIQNQKVHALVICREPFLQKSVLPLSDLAAHSWQRSVELFLEGEGIYHACIQIKSKFQQENTHSQSIPMKNKCPFEETLRLSNLIQVF